MRNRSDSTGLRIAEALDAWLLDVIPAMTPYEDPCVTVIVEKRFTQSILRWSAPSETAPIGNSYMDSMARNLRFILHLPVRLYGQADLDLIKMQFEMYVRDRIRLAPEEPQYHHVAFHELDYLVWLESEGMVTLQPPMAPAVLK